jgi:two-component system chemotaxis response regulator CheY
MLRDKYKVITLPRPEKLKGLLSNTTPNLFLLDFNMPGISGFDLIPVIRGHPGHESTPIIFFTSEGTIDHLTVAVDLGVCDFIVKPVDMDVLREKVAKHLAK